MEYKNDQIAKAAEQVAVDIKKLNHRELNDKYFSKEGILTQLLQKIKDLPQDEKAQYRKEVNILKSMVSEAIVNQEIAQKYTPSTKNRIDPTAPYDINTPKSQRPVLPSEKGSRHPLTQELEHILSVFHSMGFEVAQSRQLDDDYHMFGSLNFPEGHPARDLWDTFWTTDNLIPPAHTSSMQNRIMSSNTPPIRYVIPGRCFRNEATDASHEHTLHQIEGIYIDKNVTLGDMLGTIKTYLEAFFNTELSVKVQPAYFPFTEPDLEFLISCPFCKGTGCSVCGNTGWIEAMGCGMIHPNVLKEAGIDPEVYSGFAWGFGLDRLVMIKNGIEDIRWLHSGKLEFLKSF